MCFVLIPVVFIFDGYVVFGFYGSTIKVLVLLESCRIFKTEIYTFMIDVGEKGDQN